MTNPTRTGALVLQALSEGRNRAITRARDVGAHNERAIRRALDHDILAGYPERGRSTRIAHAVRGQVRVPTRDGMERDWISRQGVEKILQRLSSGCDSLVSTRVSSITE